VVPAVAEVDVDVVVGSDVQFRRDRGVVAVPELAQFTLPLPPIFRFEPLLTLAM